MKHLLWLFVLLFVHTGYAQSRNIELQWKEGISTENDDFDNMFYVFAETELGILDKKNLEVIKILYVCQTDGENFASNMWIYTTGLLADDFSYIRVKYDDFLTQEKIEVNDQVVESWIYFLDVEGVIDRMNTWSRMIIEIPYLNGTNVRISLNNKEGTKWIKDTNTVCYSMRN